MSDDNTYNGWSNVETYIAAEWVGGSLAEWRKQGETVTTEYARELVDTLIKTATDEDRNGLVAELAESAVSRINFHEIAKAIQGDNV